jgi:multidrug efflux system outer membrane protein
VPEALQPQGLGAQTPTLDALPGNLPSDVLLRRPDVLQAEHQLIAQNANIGARAAFFPTISLTATIGTISSTLSNLFEWHGHLPPFPVGQPAAVQLREEPGQPRLCESRADAAVATYQKTIQTAFREVADALAQRGTIDEQLSAQTAGDCRAAGGNAV